ncbi:MAG: hypothetical protein RRY23_00195 [Alistipes sp.]
MQGGRSLILHARMRQAVFTAEELRTANPLLLKDEIAYERDTGRRKMGDGVKNWNSLPYMAGNEVPALMWKVAAGDLYVKVATSLDNPILQQCYVGILHYKNARARKNKLAKRRTVNRGYKVVDDDYTLDPRITWTKIRLTPMRFDIQQAQSRDGWMRIISEADLAARYIEQINDSSSTNGISFKLHKGSCIGGELTLGVDKAGKTMQKVTFYAGVVLCMGGGGLRIEGPRSLFKVVRTNYEATSTSITHI